MFKRRAPFSSEIAEMLGFYQTAAERSDDTAGDADRPELTLQRAKTPQPRAVSLSLLRKNARKRIRQCRGRA
jgi:hypothetical protein